jgi:hypothetical protein
MAITTAINQTRANIFSPLPFLQFRHGEGQGEGQRSTKKKFPLF